MQIPEKRTTNLKTNNYIRFEFNDIPIYIDPKYPNWIAVNPLGDTILKKIFNGDKTQNNINCPEKNLNILDAFHQKKLMDSIPIAPYETYKGRSEYIQLSHLDECWLHITNNCNLKCSHCLFSCSSEKTETLSYDDIKRSVDETYQAGAKIFYLTGGEPFVHKNIEKILSMILLDYKDTSLVVMTNGINIPKHISFLQTLPKDRLYFQVSADGTYEKHDQTRGKGAFQALLKGLTSLKELNTRNTLAMAVHSENIFQMKDLIDIAKTYKMHAVHYLWLMVTGSAKSNLFVDPNIIFSNLIDASIYAKEKEIEIDNIRNMSFQVFSPAGTRYDLGNAGWRSIAIGPDKNIYPSAATVGEERLNCGNIDSGIVNVWKNSSVLNQLRKTSVKDSKTYQNSPFQYITGGGDIDHSYYSGGKFEGHDPYLPLYEKMALWIISEKVKTQIKHVYLPYPQILLKMGDIRLNCHSDGGGISLTHSNCVLTFSNSRKVVGDFYTQADKSQNENIINPVCYPETEISHIPNHSRIKSYGCGSPVLDAEIQENDVIVDLGSGAGVECFIASKKTGKNGKVYGIDMLDHMLDKANNVLPEVSKNLGFQNITFKKGFLEEIPLNTNEADLIISNCVINLSEDKRKTFNEIFRVLKPGGRLFISDVVTDTMSPPSIQNDEQLQGECISGAMVQTHLFSMLETIGFIDISIRKRFFYRKVKNHNFYSLTYTAYKPQDREIVEIVYPGPYAAVITDDGEILIRGQKYKIKKPFDPELLSPQVHILDSLGNTSNIEATNSCCSFNPLQTESSCDCYIPTEKKESSFLFTPLSQSKNKTNCMVCGKELKYQTNNGLHKCYYCSKEFSASVVCKDSHYVCDSCHGKEAFTFVQELLINTKSCDLIDLINTIRSHPSVNVHGPEHHFIIPGVITAVYKNLGGNLSQKDIFTSIERGKEIPGGVCAFWGGCGAVLGAGIGFGIILDSTPLKPKQRQIVQKIVTEISQECIKFKAERCCQRECWSTLLKVSELSEKYLNFKLPANGQILCKQMHKNKECIKQACPFASLKI